MLDNDKVKNAAKGVPQGTKRTIHTLDIYRDVHDRKIKSINFANGTIESGHKKKVYTITNEKRALSGLYKNIYWLNSVDSVAFDHPNIKRKLVDNHGFISKRIKIG